MALMNLTAEQEKGPLHEKSTEFETANSTGVVQLKSPQLVTQLVLERIPVNSKKETLDILSSIDKIINRSKGLSSGEKKKEEKKKEGRRKKESNMVKRSGKRRALKRKNIKK